MRGPSEIPWPSDDSLLYSPLDRALDGVLVRSCDLDEELRRVSLTLDAPFADELGDLQRRRRVLRLTGVSRFAFDLSDRARQRIGATGRPVVLEDLGPAIERGFEVRWHDGEGLLDVNWGTFTPDLATLWGSEITDPVYDVTFDAGATSHTLDLYGGHGPDGRSQPWFGIRIWFESFDIIDDRGEVVPNEVFYAETHMPRPTTSCSTGCWIMVGVLIAAFLLGLALVIASLVS